MAEPLQSPQIPIARWGKDHWSLLAYVETRCVDYTANVSYAEVNGGMGPNVGVLDAKHMRTSPKLHPHLGCDLTLAASKDREYPTRIKRDPAEQASLDAAVDAAIEYETSLAPPVGEGIDADTAKQRYSFRSSEEIYSHDDWSCLEDLEREGLLEIISLANYYVALTDRGWELALELREHKGRGGNFHGFSPQLVDPTPA